MAIRALVAALAIAPFVALVVAMLTGRARVTACCGDRGALRAAGHQSEAGDEELPERAATGPGGSLLS